MFDFPNAPVVNQTVTAPNGGFFIWDGTKWSNGAGPTPTLYLPISGGAMTGPLTLSGNATQPLHAVPLQQMQAAVLGINVRSFGAKGDGVTDDTASLLSAANAGGTLYFPAGVYQVSASIKLPSNTTVRTGDSPPPLRRDDWVIPLIRPLPRYCFLIRRQH